MLPVRLRAASVASILIYAVIAIVVLSRAELVSTDLPEGAVRTTTWVIVGYFFLGVGLNIASRSRAERSLMSPVAAVLCALCAIVASD